MSFLVLTRGNPVLQFPFHPDDYDLLTLSVETFGMPSVRPVSRFLMAMLADLGMHWFYETLLVLVVLYLVLCVLFAARVLAVRLSNRELVLGGFVVGLTYFLFEAAPETVRYTGHMTNVLSTLFAMLAALVLLRERPSTVWSDVGAVCLCLLSVYAKDDCAPFVLLVAALRVAGDVHRGGVRKAIRAGAVLGALLAAMISAFLYHRYVILSPFLSGEGHYQLSFRLPDLAGNVTHLLTLSRHVAVTLVCLGLASLATIFVRPEAFVRLAALWGLILALLLPYAALTRHVYQLYAYNWLPLMLAGIVVMGVSCARRVGNTATRAVLIAGGVAIVVGLYVLATPARNEAAQGFTRQQRQNRAIVAEVVRHREALRAAPLIAITGLDVPRHPWMFTDARYINELLRRDVRWLLVAEPDSFASWVYAEFNRPRDERSVTVISSNCLPMLAGVPQLQFEADLSTRLVPGTPSRPGGRAQTRIDFGADDGLGRLCHGWSAPESSGGRRFRWAEGSEAILLVALPRGIDLRFRIGVRPPAPSAPRRAVVLVDGAPVGWIDVSANGEPVEVSVPHTVIRDSVSTVSFRFSGIDTEDARAPAAAFEWLEVRRQAQG